MIFFDGLKRDTFGPGDHERLFGSLWTAGRVGTVGKAATAISIDQMIATRWAPARETSFPSLQFAVQNWFWGGSFAREGATDSEMIYSGPNTKIPAEWDPYKMYAKLFGNGVAGAGAGENAEFTRLRAQRKSLLDFVNKELASLSTQVAGKGDKAKIEHHLDAVRDVEKTLQAPAATCGAIESPEGMIDSKQNDNHPKLIPIMNKLLTAALRCDRTRVASLQYSRAFSQLFFRWIPGMKADRFHHDISHMANDPRIGIIQQWYQARFAELLQMFKDVSEFGEPMLNNMLVVNAMEMETAWNHNCAKRQPNWMAGKLGGRHPAHRAPAGLQGRQRPQPVPGDGAARLRPDRRQHDRQPGHAAREVAGRAGLISPTRAHFEPLDEAERGGGRRRPDRVCAARCASPWPNPHRARRRRRA